MKLAYSYIRFSTKEQAKGDSFRRQTVKADEWAAAHGYQIVKTYKDLGVSGYSGKNRKTGELGEFLAAVECGEIPKGSILILESWDRFSRRTPREVLPDFLDVINAGVGIVTLTDGQLFTAASLDANGTQLFISLSVMMRGHEESRRKAGMLSEAWVNKRRLARAGSKKVTDRIPAWLDVVSTGEGKSKERKFVPNRQRVRVVERIFRETARGYGRRAIAKRLNDERIPAFRSKEGWQPSYIAKLIRGHAVLGEYEPHQKNKEGKRIADKEGAIKNYYPAVIKQRLWDAANRAADNRITSDVKGRLPETNTSANLIPSIAHCVCGARMAYLNKGTPPKGGRYYACGKALRNADCDLVRHWNQEIVEKALFYQIDQAALENLYEPKGQTKPQVTELDYGTGIRELRRQLEKAVKHFLQDETEDPTMKKVVDDLRKDISSREAEQKLVFKAQTIRPDPESAAATWKAARAFRTRLDGAQGDDLIKLRLEILVHLRTALNEVRFSEDTIYISVEVPSMPSNKILAAWMGNAKAESKTIEGIDRHFIIHRIYTEEPRIAARLGIPVRPGKGMFCATPLARTA